MVLHHLMVGTWTPPGAIFSFEFDDELRTLKLINRAEIPQDEPISWMTFNVRTKEERRETVECFASRHPDNHASTPEKPSTELL